MFIKVTVIDSTYVCPGIPGEYLQKTRNRWHKKEAIAHNALNTRRVYHMEQREPFTGKSIAC